jgi:Fe2+ transport system protein B
MQKKKNNSVSSTLWYHDFIMEVDKYTEDKRWFVMQIWQRKKQFNKEIGNLILTIALIVKFSNMQKI